MTKVLVCLDRAKNFVDPQQATPREREHIVVTFGNDFYFLKVRRRAPPQTDPGMIPLAA
jgi:hypothetical protein